MTDSEIVMDRLSWSDTDLVLKYQNKFGKGITRQSARDSKLLLSVIPLDKYQEVVDSFVRPFYLETKFISSKEELQTFMDSLRPHDEQLRDARLRLQESYRELLATK